MVISTAASSVPSVEEGGAEAVVDAARYGAVPTLVEGLLHDVRNPLNALAIHIEVLAERIKLETGQVPPAQDKSLNSMREQIRRVDGLLKQFSDFLIFREGTPGEADLSAAVSRALEVLAHESRRRRLKVHATVPPGVRVRVGDTGELGFLVVQPVLRAFSHSEAGSEVEVSVTVDDSRAVLRVECGGAAEQTHGHDVMAALEVRCEQLGVALESGRTSCRLVFQRA